MFPSFLKCMDIMFLIATQKQPKIAAKILQINIKPRLCETKIVPTSARRLVALLNRARAARIGSEGAQPHLKTNFSIWKNLYFSEFIPSASETSVPS